MTDATDDVEQLGDLGRRPPQHLAQDQHGALAGREQLQRGDEGQADGLPQQDVGLRVVGGGQHLDVRDRLDEGLLGQCRAEPVGRHAGGAEVDGPLPALAPLDGVEADVGGDAIQPGPHRGATLVPLGRPPRPQQRLLHGVLGLVHRAQHPIAVTGQLRPVATQRRLDLTATGHVRQIRHPDHRTASVG